MQCTVLKVFHLVAGIQLSAYTISLPLKPRKIRVVLLKAERESKILEYNEFFYPLLPFHLFYFSAHTQITAPAHDQLTAVPSNLRPKQLHTLKSLYILYYDLSQPI